jgi:hypothetical protein
MELLRQFFCSSVVFHFHHSLFPQDTAKQNFNTKTTPAQYSADWFKFTVSADDVCADFSFIHSLDVLTRNFVASFIMDGVLLLA